jgi:hypothetical protein
MREHEWSEPSRFQEDSDQTVAGKSVGEIEQLTEEAEQLASSGQWDEHEAVRNGETLRFWYQGTPKKLRKTSIYSAVARQHDLPATSLLPDTVLEVPGKGTTSQWILVEIKGGPKRSVRDNARAALGDLLGYRRDYQANLQEGAAYGIGIGWGEGLRPNPEAEVMLVSPDYLHEALSYFVG